MSINDLRAIVIGSPTEGAVNNALTILMGLARDGDFDALKAILQLLALELGLDPDRPSLTDARSIQELLSASDVPPLLRVYATAFQPRDFLAQVNAVATLASEASSSRCFSAFQSLVRRHGALQHEALKAYVLIAFSGMNKMLHPQDRVGFISPGGQLAILDVILSNCRVVAGENADASLQFGHDLLLRLTGVDQFLSIIHHELGHNILDTVWGSPHSTTMRPYEDCLCEIASALPSLLDSACRLGGKPLQFGDPRSFKAASGVSILCTQVQHTGGTYFHWSLTQQSGPIEVQVGALHAFFILSVLGMELSKTAVAFSARGVLHFGYGSDTPVPGALSRRIAQIDLKELVKLSSSESHPWFDNLRLAGRVGKSEGDVITALGIVAKQPTFYGAIPQQTIQDFHYVASLRSLHSIPTLSDDQARAVLAAIWRCADTSLFRKLLQSKSAPSTFLRSAQLQLSEIGQSLCAIRDEKGVVYHGATLEEILHFIKTLHEFGGDIDVPLNLTGDTLLLEAIGKCPQLVRFLLECGADPNRPNNVGETPLHACAEYGSFEMAKELIAANASVQVRNRHGDTVLHRVAARGDHALMQLLLSKGADVNARNKLGETPLMAARSADAVQMLCRTGATVNSVRLDGASALILAASARLVPVVRSLLEFGANPDAANQLGETAVHHAVGAEDSTDCLQALLDAKADVDEETNEGVTPLMVAASIADLPSIRFLLAKGAQIDATTTNGTTALIKASDGRNEWSRDFSFCSRIEKCLSELVSSGANINASNDAGITALHAATWGFDAGRVRLLLELGADANLRSSEDVSPLGVAAAKGHEAMVKSLIAAGADIQASDKQGNTPLLLAIKAGSGGVGAVQPLIEAGASVTHVNAAGESAIQLSNRKEVSEEVRQLVLAARFAEEQRNEVFHD